MRVERDILSRAAAWFARETGAVPPRAAAQNRREWVVDGVGLTEGTTLLLLVMAYRLLREFRQALTRLDTPPSQSAITQLLSTPVQN